MGNLPNPTHASSTQVLSKDGLDLGINAGQQGVSGWSRLKRTKEHSTSVQDIMLNATVATNIFRAALGNSSGVCCTVRECMHDALGVGHIAATKSALGQTGRDSEPWIFSEPLLFC